MEQYTGEIKIYSINYIPRDWALCDGKILQINSNRDLFDVIQNYYGGDASQGTFALPDLRGRVPLGFGSAASNYLLGQNGGQVSVTISKDQLPRHSHDFKACKGAGNTPLPVGTYVAAGAAGDIDYSNLGISASTEMATNAIGTTGSSVPVDIYQPLLGINFIIALKGIRPTKP